MGCHHCGFGGDETVSGGLCPSCGQPVGSSAPHVLPPGTLLQQGAFVIRELLGQGGFGITYRAFDTTLERYVAIKELFPQGCQRAGGTVVPAGSWSPDAFSETRLRFLKEAQAMAAFTHENIVRVFTQFQENNTAYIVMELIEGANLSHIVKAEGAMSEAAALQCFARIADALDAVHRAGMLHRDVNPNNILREISGRWVLIDFGTARQFLGGATQNHSVMITPGFAPMEQYAERAPRGPYTDVYALAATLYFALTAQTPPSAAERVTGARLPPLAERLPNLRPSLSEAVSRALSTDPAARPQTMRAFVEAVGGPSSPAALHPASPTWLTDLPKTMTADAARKEESRQRLNQLLESGRYKEARKEALTLQEILRYDPSDDEKTMKTRRQVAEILDKMQATDAAPFITPPRLAVAAIGAALIALLIWTSRATPSTVAVAPSPQIQAEPTPSSSSPAPAPQMAAPPARPIKTGQPRVAYQNSQSPPHTPSPVPSTMGARPPTTSARPAVIAVDAPTIRRTPGRYVPYHPPTSWRTPPAGGDRDEDDDEDAPQAPVRSRGPGMYALTAQQREQIRHEEEGGVPASFLPHEVAPAGIENAWVVNQLRGAIPLGVQVDFGRDDELRISVLERALTAGQEVRVVLRRSDQGAVLDEKSQRSSSNRAIQYWSVVFRPRTQWEAGAYAVDVKLDGNTVRTLQLRVN